MYLNRKNVFLFDGVGATLSALLTGLVLPYFSEWTGLQSDILYRLAMFPIVYAIYSFSCYFFVQNYTSKMLLAIIGANFVYCLVSGSLLFTHEPLTTLGQTFLIAEIFVILIVVFIELKIYQKFYATNI